MEPFVLQAAGFTQGLFLLLTLALRCRFGHVLTVSDSPREWNVSCEVRGIPEGLALALLAHKRSLCSSVNKAKRPGDKSPEAFLSESAVTEYRRMADEFIGLHRLAGPSFLSTPSPLIQPLNPACWARPPPSA